MLRNYLTTALRILSRNRLYSAINILGLAIGFTAAIFAGLFVRNELTYEDWIPGYQRVYLVATSYDYAADGVLEEHFRGHRDAARWLKEDYPQIEAAARFGPQGEAIIRRGAVQGAESSVSWADSNLFSVLPFPVIAGNLKAALDQPDGIVLSHALARKYFGRDAPIGETIMLNQHPLRVTAVLADYPSNTDFDASAFISSQAIFARAQRIEAGSEADPNVVIGFGGNVFVRLKPGAMIAPINRDMPAFVARHMPHALGPIRMRLLPLAARHLDPTDNPYSRTMRNQLVAAMYGAGAMGILILLAAAISYVNATTASATRRAVEVGVRKVTGAERRQLMVQFMGESVAQVLLALALAVALAALLPPWFDSLIGQKIVFVPWRDVRLGLGIVITAAAVGLLASLYPSLVLASLRPAVVLRAGPLNASGSGAIRQGLVMLQFVVLISIAAVTLVAYRQTSYAMNGGLRFDKDQLLTISGACTAAMEREVQALPGVRAAACGAGIGMGGYYTNAIGGHGQALHDSQDAVFAVVDYGLFELLGLKPIAGRFFDRIHGEDSVSSGAPSNPSVVINQSTVRAMGFASPSQAIGQIIRWRRMPPTGPTGSVAAAPTSVPLLPSRIIGVVPDYSEWSETPIFSRIYYVDPTVTRALNVKLSGRDIPETLAAIDQLWAKVVDPNRPAPRQFMEQHLEFLYRDLLQQTRTVAMFAAVALLVAALGLFGLSAFTAERRTKEIGIRKAMGASRTDILRLLFWEFSKPVLWGNAIAWPVAFGFARRWLGGFANRIELGPGPFVAASALALVIAILTVSGHALLIARTRPASALRYE